MSYTASEYTKIGSIRKRLAATLTHYASGRKTTTFDTILELPDQERQHSMSFDITAAHFEHGQATPANSEVLEGILKPFIQKLEPEHSFARLRFSDGEADLYGIGRLSKGFTINHISGLDVWDMLFELAQQGGLTIMAPGCPTLVTSDATRANLPDDLRSDAAVVTSGAELHRLLTA